MAYDTRVATASRVAERIGEWLETVPCPVCGAERFEVLRPARYPAVAGAGELRTVHRTPNGRLRFDRVVRCRSCSLVYLNPRPIPAPVPNGHAEAEDRMFVARNEARIRAFGRTLGSILRELKFDCRWRNLLDIGCGGGAFLVAARRYGFETVGVEPSRWLASFGRDRYLLDIRDGVLDPGMFEPGSFDVVTLWDSVEQLPNPHDTLAAAASLLEPGGLLLVNYPDVGSLAARLLGKRWPFWQGEHWLYYTRTTMARQLERAGFRVVGYRPFRTAQPLGYAARRAAQYFPAMGAAANLLAHIGLAETRLTYNLGQTLVVARVG
ncbi:MAG: class I SAM-dependent methyltransferase [Bryobacteraceae bacterium]